LLGWTLRLRSGQAPEGVCPYVSIYPCVSILDGWGRRSLHGLGGLAYHRLTAARKEIVP